VGLEEERLTWGQNAEFTATAGLPEVDFLQARAGGQEAVPVVVSHADVSMHGNSALLPSLAATRQGSHKSVGSITRTSVWHFPRPDLSEVNRDALSSDFSACTDEPIIPRLGRRRVALR
jgi:hypothetical protein